MLTIVTTTNIMIPPDIMKSIINYKKEKRIEMNPILSDYKEGEEYTFIFTREAFERVIDPVLILVQKTIISVLHNWRNNLTLTEDLRTAAVDEVVLVGGCSKIPSIRSALRTALGVAGEDCFASTSNPKEFCTSIDPDEAVAQGLAIRGGVLMGVQEGVLKDLLMLDALPTTIGIRSFAPSNAHDVLAVRNNAQPDITEEEGYFEPILTKGSRLPAKATKTFALADKTQKMVSLDIYEEGCEDENPEIVLIGTYDVPIPPSLKNIENESKTDNNLVDVTFHMDENREMSFIVKRYNEDSLVLKKHENISNISIVFLIVYIILLGVLYLIVKMFVIPDNGTESLDNEYKEIMPSTLIGGGHEGEEF